MSSILAGMIIWVALALWTVGAGIAVAFFDVHAKWVIVTCGLAGLLAIGAMIVMWLMFKHLAAM